MQGHLPNSVYIATVASTDRRGLHRSPRRYLFAREETMLKHGAKISLVATSLAPIFLTLAFLAHMAGHNYAAAGWTAAVVLLVAVASLILSAASHQLQVFPIEVSKLKTADREVVAFLLTYVLPLALVNLHDFSVDWHAIGFLVAIFAVVVWGTHAYDFNPLLGIIGYHFFEVESRDGLTYVLITRRVLNSVREVTKVVRLTEYVLFDKG